MLWVTASAQGAGEQFALHAVGDDALLFEAIERSADTLLVLMICDGAVVVAAGDLGDGDVVIFAHIVEAVFDVAGPCDFDGALVFAAEAEGEGFGVGGGVAGTGEHGA